MDGGLQYCWGDYVPCLLGSCLFHMISTYFAGNRWFGEMPSWRTFSCAVRCSTMLQNPPLDWHAMPWLSTWTMYLAQTCSSWHVLPQRWTVGRTWRHAWQTLDCRQCCLRQVPAAAANCEPLSSVHSLCIKCKEVSQELTTDMLVHFSLHAPALMI